MILQVEVVLVLVRLVIVRTFIHPFCVSRQDIRILWVSFIFVSQSGLEVFKAWHRRVFASVVWVL